MEILQCSHVSFKDGIYDTVAGKEVAFDEAYYWFLAADMRLALGFDIYRLN